MKTRAFLIIAIVLSCGQPPEFLPPPFGPQGPTNTRFFFPTGLAVLPDGSLLVANGNFNHAYDGGTLVSVKKSYIDAFFAKNLQCDVTAQDPACIDDVSLHPGDVFGGAVMTGNYAGPVALNDNGTLAFTAGRDSGRLNVVEVRPDLSLQCVAGGGSGGDCRGGLIDLTTVGV